MQVKIQKINACKWKFRKLMLASENSGNECLQVRKWKFRKWMLASENSEKMLASENLCLQVKIQKMYACKWKFRCLQVKIQKMNACKWKFRKCMLASENSENVMLARENSEN